MKKHLIIFEGIATAGKTTLSNKLAELLNTQTSAISITDERTLLPIFNNKDINVAKNHLIQELTALTKLETKYIVLERTHLTQVFRTETSLQHFFEVETFMLENFDPRIILLTVQPDTLQIRIEHADAQRGNLWSQKKLGTIDERAEYYVNQQDVLCTALSESKIPSLKVDTTDKKWDEALLKITKWLHI